MINLKKTNLAQNLAEEFANKIQKSTVYKQKMKDFKTWAQVKGPKILQPALSYTLGWLSPEMLGTGFRMVQVSDFSIKALIPANAMNVDQFQEIHQGLVLNASLELAHSFLQRHMPEACFQIVASDIKIQKKQKWNSELQLVLATEELTLDQFFSEMQERKKADIHFKINIETTEKSQNTNIKKADSVDLKLICEATQLLA